MLRLKHYLGIISQPVNQENYSIICWLVMKVHTIYQPCWKWHNMQFSTVQYNFLKTFSIVGICHKNCQNVNFRKCAFVTFLMNSSHISARILHCILHLISWLIFSVVVKSIVVVVGNYEYPNSYTCILTSDP